MSEIDLAGRDRSELEAAVVMMRPMVSDPELTARLEQDPSQLTDAELTALVADGWAHIAPAIRQAFAAVVELVQSALQQVATAMAPVMDLIDVYEAQPTGDEETTTDG